MTLQSIGSTRSQRTVLDAILKFLRGNPIWILAVAMIVFFGLMSPYFFTTYNLSNIIAQCALTGFLAVGLTPIIVSGNIDLTVGSVVGLAACLVIGLQAQLGLPLSILIALGAGVGLGFFNGILVEKLGINSFIVTLGGMIGVRGLAFLYAGDVSLSPPDASLYNIGAWSLGPVTSITLAFLIVVIVFNWIMSRTTHGRYTYAIGGNRTAAVDAGIRVSFHVIINFALCGLMAAVCGIATAANLGAATPSFGKDYELWAVIAVVLGGTSLRGGRGTLVGTFAAVLTLSILRNGLNLVQVSPFYVPAIMGVALIAVLVFDRQFGPRRRRTGE